MTQELLIQARAFEIPYTPFSHNFWVLLLAPDIILDQLHGLAVDPKTGLTKAIGNSSHLLQAVSNPQISWSLQPGQPTTQCVCGPSEEIAKRWQSALLAIPDINALRISYPDIWQHGYKKNSNTMYNSLGQIMGFPEPAKLLPTWAPGVSKVISPSIIDRYRYVKEL